MTIRIRQAGRRAWSKAVGLWLRQIIRKYYKRILALRHFHCVYGSWEKVFKEKARRQWKAERRLWREKKSQIKTIPAALVALTLADSAGRDSEIKEAAELLKKAMDLDPDFFAESVHGEFLKKMKMF